MASREGTIRSGFGFLGVGVAISVVGYGLAATSGATHYYVATGALAFGVIRLCQGLLMAPDPEPVLEDRAADDDEPSRSWGPEPSEANPRQARRTRRARLLGLKR